MRWARSDRDFAIRMADRLVGSLRARLCEPDLIGRAAERSLDEQLALLVDRRMRQADELAGLVAIVPPSEAARLVAACADERWRSVDVALERWVASLDPRRRSTVVGWIDDMLSPTRIERLRTLDYSEREIHELLLTQVHQIADHGALRHRHARPAAADGDLRNADHRTPPPSSSDTAS